MRRAIVRDPTDTVGRFIRLLLHDQIDQAMKRIDPCILPADPKKLGAPDIPRRHISHSAAAFVFEFHAS